MSLVRRGTRAAVEAAPVITGLGPSHGPLTGGNPVVITGSGLASTGSVRFGATGAVFAVGSDNQITAIAPPGTGAVSVTVTTSSGASNGLPYRYGTPVPALTSLNPTTGPASGGNLVVLTGTGLINITAVRFGADLAAFTVASPTQINAIAPPGTGTAPVSVTNAAGTSDSQPYRYLPAPVITAITPANGPVQGGNTVTLTGENFTSVAAVTFGSTPASSFTVVSGTTMTAVVPGGNPPGPVQVTVATSSGTSNGFAYFSLTPPAVSTVAPNQGPTTGGTAVTLLGTGFTGATNVRFGATAASSFTVFSDNQINAVAPPGSGVVQVVVTTAGGSNPQTAAGAYTFLSAPILSDLTPKQGPASGGNSVELTGADFTFAGEVRFGGTLAPFMVLSDTEIVATAPFGGNGAVAVTVTTPGGTSAGVAYTFVAPPGG
jgi:IPT/TIG domain-containing protein